MNERDSGTNQKKVVLRDPPTRLLRLIVIGWILFAAQLTAYAQTEITATTTENKPTEQHRLKLFAGAAQIFESQVDPVIGFELNPGWRWHGVGLWASLCGGKRTGSYAAFGMLYDFSLSEKWRLTPSFGLGYFKEGQFTLGNELEFRSALELSHEFQRSYRIGISLAHISNASLSNINPGTEAICVSVSFPIF